METPAPSLSPSPALEEGVQRYIRLRKHVLRTKDKIQNQLARLRTTHPEDWQILTKVRDLLDDLDQVKNWDYGPLSGSEFETGTQFQSKDYSPITEEDKNAEH